MSALRIPFPVPSAVVSRASARLAALAAPAPALAAPSSASRLESELQLAQQCLDAYVPAAAAGCVRLHKLIGRGAFGAVYRATSSSSGAAGADLRVAVKHVVSAFASPLDARRIYREVHVMAHFSHPNLLPLRAVLAPRAPGDFSHVYLVTELMETDLHRVIASRQNLTSDHVAFFIYQTLCGLKHLHTAGVLCVGGGGGGPLQ